MSIRRTVKVDAEVESVGQFDRIERWKGELEVTRNGERVRVGQPTQSGFSALTVEWNDLQEAAPGAKAARIARRGPSGPPPPRTPGTENNARVAPEGTRMIGSRHRPGPDLYDDD